MRRSILLFVRVLAGCQKPFRTDSVVSVHKTVPVRLAATFEAKDNACPLVEVPVEGGGCCKGPRVAVIDVDGLLVNLNQVGPYSSGDNPVDLLREKLDAAAHSSDVCAVVLRINSPGGAVTATDIMWQEVQNFRARCKRPVVACL